MNHKNRRRDAERFISRGGAWASYPASEYKTAEEWTDVYKAWLLKMRNAQKEVYGDPSTPEEELDELTRDHLKWLKQFG